MQTLGGERPPIRVNYKDENRKCILNFRKL